MSMDDWKAFLDIVGLIVLFLTFALGGAALLVGNRINKRDSAKLRAFETEARNQLARQEERTAIAEKATEEIRRENITRDELLTASQKEALTLRGQIAALETKAAEQQERAAKAELSLLEVRHSIAPRGITPDQRVRLVALLANSPKGSFTVTWAPSPESESFASQVATVMIEAGWVNTAEDGDGIFGISNGVAMIEPMAGLVVMVRDLNNAPIRAKSIADALAAEGFKVSARAVNLNEGSVHIHVGTK